MLSIKYFKILTGIICIFGIVFISYQFFSYKSLKQKCLDSLNGEIKYSIEFRIGTEDEGVERAAQEIRKLSAIRNVSALTAEEVRARFQEKHKDNNLILESLKELGSNPFSSILEISFIYSADTNLVSELQKIFTDKNIVPEKFDLDSIIQVRKSSIERYPKIEFLDYLEFLNYLPIPDFGPRFGKKSLQLCIASSK